MTFYYFASAHLMVMGVLTITLLASVRHPRLVRVGFWCGLYNQWAWYYVAIHDQSWGIACINLAYTINYLRAIVAHWGTVWGSTPVSTPDETSLD